jgi:protein SCO1/2
MLTRMHFFVAVLLVLWSTACQREAEHRLLTAHGIVKEVAVERNSIRIAHDDIPGFMSAMTMEFAVKDPTILAGVQPEDEVNFTLEQTLESLYLVKIERLTKSGEGSEPPSAESVPPADSIVWELAETSADFVPFPAADFTLTDQDGQPLTLSSLRGKVVLLDFIFTTCPGPCPILSLKFSRLQQRLGERLGKDVMLLSVTIDPRRDTPEVLKEYAGRYQANLSGWKFLTGTTRDIIMVAAAYGADYQAGAEGIIDHRLLTCVIDRDGTVVKEFAGVNHTVDDFVAEVERLLVARS